MYASSGARRRGECGFTIVELLAVISIIALLGALVVGLSRFASEKSAEAKVRADLELLRNAIEEYRIQRAAYPLIQGADTYQRMIPPSDPDVAPPQSDGPMVRFTYDLLQIDRSLNFIDPWRTNYFYRVTPDRLRFEVRSSGSDRQIGTQYDVY